jgi:chitosanase
MLKKLVVIIFIVSTLICNAQPFTSEIDEDTRTIFFCLVSSAENSSLNYKAQYAYIEDISDGRGYTAGIIGFTSATGDLLEVVKLYASLKPLNNPLKKYIPSLEKVNGTPSHRGLGKSFVKAWKKASSDTEMIMAQDSILDTMYYNPAFYYAQIDSLSTLGTFIYYDALVVHGPGDDEDSFGGIRKATLSVAHPPSENGDEKQWLESFLKIRTYVMKKEAAHSDLSRIVTQQKFINEKNYNLSLPLYWDMYGDKFTLLPKQ